MGTSKAQHKKLHRICACGCGKSFYPFPIYKNQQVIKNLAFYDTIIGKKGATLYIPLYIRGHHPKCQKGRLNGQGWNKGLTKETCPILKRMGYQPGHIPYGDWSHVNERLKNDPKFRKKWLESKKGQVAWNKGLTKKDYKNGFASGKKHGNWKGGKRGIYDTAALRAFSKSIMARDKWTCQECGDHNYKGRGSRIQLEVHHIIAIREDHTLALVPSNAITLCKKCHIKTDNYGTKLIHKLKNQGGN